MAPRNFYVNGHVMIDHEKMSKQNGNFITIRDGIERYGRDALRFTLAYAGDGISDANFETTTAESIQTKLEKTAAEICEILDGTTNYTFKDNEQVTDYFFVHQTMWCVENVRTNFNEFKLKEVCRFALFEMDRIKRDYLKWGKPREDFLKLWAFIHTLLMAPIVPDWSFDILKTRHLDTPTVLEQKYPFVAPEYQPEYVEKAEFYEKIWHHINKKLEFFNKYNDSVEKIHVIFVKEYPSYFGGLKNILKAHFAGETKTVMKDIALEVKKFGLSKKASKKVIAMAQETVKSGDASANEFEGGSQVEVVPAELDEMVRSMAALAGVTIEYELLERDDENNTIPILPRVSLASL
jgi:leucyl-tRNA synthetase